MVGDFRSREAQQFFAGLDAPKAVQERFLLEQVVGRNVDCEFGRRHGFASIRSAADFRRAVPISRYEAFEPAISRTVERGEQGLLTTEPVKRFFLTSGSTARAKYIPVTSSFVRAKSRAFGIYWACALEQHPEVEVGRMVTNFSDSGAAVRAPGGLPCSSESAYWAGVTRATSLAAEPIIPEAVARIADVDARYFAIARILLQARFGAIMTLNPSTILLLFRKLHELADALVDDVARTDPARAAGLRELARTGELVAHRVWPDLRLAISWRSPMLQPYLDLLAPHLVGVAGRDYILMASEGVMAIPIADGTSGGPVAIGVHYYEFVPESEHGRAEPTVLAPHELEVGGRYVVVLTNGSGLYRYDIGDVVRVTGFCGRTPCIEFLHRVGATSSLTGEKLTEDQVTAAVGEVARASGVRLTSFTVAPAKGGFPRYVVLAELERPVDREVLQGFAGRFDDALARRNLEYGAKRSSQRLGAPELWLVAPGSWAARRRARLAAGASDGQIKPVHLSRDASVCDELDVIERFAG